MRVRLVTPRSNKRVVEGCSIRRSVQRQHPSCQCHLRCPSNKVSRPHTAHACTSMMTFMSSMQRPNDVSACGGHSMVIHTSFLICVASDCSSVRSSRLTLLLGSYASLQGSCEHDDSVNGNHGHCQRGQNNDSTVSSGQRRQHPYYHCAHQQTANAFT
jgi:hypothetical protein